MIIIVDAELDLVETAARFVDNDELAVKQWLSENRVRKAVDDDARQWHEQDADFWAVVAAPWVLVQKVTSDSN